MDESQSSMSQVDIILSKFQPFTCLCLDSNDSYLAAACQDGTISIYDIKSQMLLNELSGHGDGSCTSFRFSPNVVDAVSSSDKGQLLVRVFDPFHFYFLFILRIHHLSRYGTRDLGPENLRFHRFRVPYLAFISFQGTLLYLLQQLVC